MIREPTGCDGGRTDFRALFAFMRRRISRCSGRRGRGRGLLVGNFHLSKAAGCRGSAPLALRASQTARRREVALAGVLPRSDRSRPLLKTLDSSLSLPPIVFAEFEREIRGRLDQLANRLAKIIMETRKLNPAG